MTRMSWLMVAVAAVVAAAFVLADQLRQTDRDHAVPAAISVDGQPAPRDRRVQTLRRSPTILQAKPVTESAAGVDYRMWSPTGSQDRPRANEGDLSQPAFEPPLQHAPESPYQQALDEQAKEEPPPIQNAWSHPVARIAATGLGESRPADEPAGDSIPATYRTRADDSFWGISEARYGVGTYYRALYTHNRRLIARPDQIEAGILLETPSQAELKRLYPELCPD